MENKLNVPKLEYKTGEPMWVHWDNRYVLRGGHIMIEPVEDLGIGGVLIMRRNVNK